MSWNQDLFKRTLDFAAKAHGSQAVPGSGFPYVVHLVKVATEVLRVADGSFDVDFAMQCALLHDCVEDAGVQVAALRQVFGEEVAQGVNALTKDESVAKADRMADSLRRIQQQRREVWMVKLADRITNLEPAPPHWSADKRVAYRAEAQVIVRALGQVHGGLAARLNEKISQYE
jgi:(p)ppGpp synthase/HD superfamily hydrolase